MFNSFGPIIFPTFIYFCFIYESFSDNISPPTSTRQKVAGESVATSWFAFHYSHECSHRVNNNKQTHLYSDTSSSSSSSSCKINVQILSMLSQNDCLVPFKLHLNANESHTISVVTLIVVSMSHIIIFHFVIIFYR